MKLIRLAAALAALLLAEVVHAGDVTLRWTHDGKNTDGTPVVLAGFRIHYGTSPAALTQVALTHNVIANSYTVSNLVPGTWYFAVTAFNANGAESVFSNIVTRTVVDAPPSPLPSAPSGLVAAGRTVFTIKQTADRVSVVAVGTVPADTACAADNGVFATGKVYFRVPVAAVTWSGSVRPVVVLADCS